MTTLPSVSQDLSSQHLQRPFGKAPRYVAFSEEGLLLTCAQYQQQSPLATNVSAQLHHDPGSIKKAGMITPGVCVSLVSLCAGCMSPGVVSHGWMPVYWGGFVPNNHLQGQRCCTLLAPVLNVSPSSTSQPISSSLPVHINCVPFLAHINSGLFSYMSTLSCLPAHDFNAETSLRTATVFWGHIFYPTFGLSLFLLSSESSPRRVGARSAFTLPGCAVTLERGGMPLARCLLGPQHHSQHPVYRVSAQSRLLRARTPLLLRPRPCLGASAPHGGGTRKPSS